MTLPRQVLPACDYMITRRCSERRFFLRPDRNTNNAFIYCLALAARRAHVHVTFTVAMSNHHHTGIHDPLGNFPVFIEHFHALLARCQNSHLGRYENFWSSEPTSVVRLIEPDDILEKITYAFANPAAADLVESNREWPGVSSLEQTCAGTNLLASRPKHFFRDNSGLPAIIRLPMIRPPSLTHLSQSEWENEIRDRLRVAEAHHRERRRQEGSSVLGRAAILRQSPFHAPQTRQSRFGIRPTVAAKNKWARSEALLRSRAFVERYRAAFRDFLAGAVNAIFPMGTYWMRKFARVCCETDEAAEGA